MKKTTLNRLLWGIIAFLILAICILIVQIANRPRYVSTAEREATVIAEAPTSDSTAAPDASQTTEDSTEITPDEAPTTLRGKTSTRVNIRDAASQDARVLETVDEGTEFDIIEILDNGWTKISYQDQEAYISSSYIILI